MIYEMTHLSGSLPQWHRGKEYACQGTRHKRHGLDPLVGTVEAEGTPGPGLPWDLARPHTETGWRHRRAAERTRHRATVPTGSWCN